MTQERLDQRFSKLLEIETCRIQRPDIRHLDAIDPFERQDIAARPLPVNIGNAETFIILDVLGNLGKCRRLAADPFRCALSAEAFQPSQQAASGA